MNRRAPRRPPGAARPPTPRAPRPAPAAPGPHPRRNGPARRVVLAPLLAGNADVVFGSRFALTQPHRVLYFWHAVGNKVITLASNMVTNLNLSDVETCYKAFRREVIQAIDIE